MSILTERLKSGTGTGAPRCSVVIPVDADDNGMPVLTRCPFDADGWYTGRCPCGHVRDGWLCTLHGSQAAEGGCRACLESDDPHDCPLPVQRATPGDSS